MRDEILGVLFFALCATVATSLWVWRLMAAWQVEPDKSSYIGYSFQWYCVTPIMFLIFWYGSMLALFVGVNLWAMFGVYSR